MSLLYFKQPPGTPYRPANGTEGISFDSEFCDRCWKDRAFRETEGREDGCKIAANAFAFDPDAPDYPKEWTHDKDGVPTCTAFEEHDAARNQRREANGRSLTLPLFQEKP